jgi:hypothetical protein
MGPRTNNYIDNIAYTIEITRPPRTLNPTSATSRTPPTGHEIRAGVQRSGGGAASGYERQYGASLTWQLEDDLAQRSTPIVATRRRTGSATKVSKRLASGLDPVGA